MPVPGRADDDGLDAVLHLEAEAAAAGGAQSASAGAAAGHASGRDLGWAAGAGMQTELQFHHGAAVALLALAESANVLGLPARAPPFPQHFAPRAVAAARRVVALVEAAPLHARGNDPALDMAALAATVRAQMRAAFASLGLRALDPPASAAAAAGRDAELSF